MSLYHTLNRCIFPTESPGFIPQFRLEGRSRDADNPDALAMRIADPLWMLGRQWQFGEFEAEDNGSPVSVAVKYRIEQPRYYSFSNDDQRWPLGKIPLEALIESMQVQPKDLRSRVRVGQQFEAMIRDTFATAKANQLIQMLRKEFPLTKSEKMDERARRFFNLMAGKVVDGGTLWEKIQQNSFPTESYTELAAIVERMKSWYKNLFLTPASEDNSWQPKNLFHRFKLHHKAEEGENDFTLSAPDYQSGHLDWYSFDRAEIKIKPDEQIVEEKGLTPVRVSVATLPDKRLYAFEDSRMDFAAMNMDTSDLVRLLLIHFSLVSGSDWYTIPIEMSLGELCWVNQLKVKDVFGVTTIINNDRETGQFLSEDGLKVWDVFKIRDKNVSEFRSPEHFLYLAPTSTFRQESTPHEELLFLRDEFANMVWAIEKTVSNELGKPTDGFELHLELNGPFIKPDDDSLSDEKMIPRYRLASPVPTNWIPYLPVQVEGSDTEIELRRAMMIRNEDADTPEDIPPLTYLAKENILTIREEAVPRAGVRVQITRQRVRWTDGKTYIWLGRKVLAGKGQGDSGLKFDQII